MHKKSALRTGILVVLLLAACYVANWAEDGYASEMAVRRHVFAYANGVPKPISGGGFNESYAFLAASDMKVLVKGKQNATRNASSNQSAFSTVFGQPLGDGSDVDESNDDGTSARGFQTATGSRTGLNGVQSPFGRSTGLSGAAAGGVFGGSLNSSFGTAFGQTGLR